MQGAAEFVLRPADPRVYLQGSHLKPLDSRRIDVFGAEKVPNILDPAMEMGWMKCSISDLLALEQLPLLQCSTFQPFHSTLSRRPTRRRRGRGGRRGRPAGN